MSQKISLVGPTLNCGRLRFQASCKEPRDYRILISILSDNVQVGELEYPLKRKHVQQLARSIAKALSAKGKLPKA